MSNGTFNTILGRIALATPQSPIAVFHKDTFDNFKHDLPTDVDQPMLDAVFADTIDTSRLIDTGHNRLIGVFHSGMNRQEVKKSIRSAMGVHGLGLTELQMSVYEQVKSEGAANVYDISAEIGCSDNATRSALTRLVNLGLLEKSSVSAFWTVPGYKGEVKKNTFKQRLQDKMKELVFFRAKDLYPLGNNNIIRSYMYNMKNEGLIRSVAENKWEWVG